LLSCLVAFNRKRRGEAVVWEVKASGDWYKMMAHEVKVIRDFGAAKRPRSLGRERDLAFHPFYRENLLQIKHS
jgi:hypothetical protein